MATAHCLWPTAYTIASGLQRTASPLAFGLWPTAYSLWPTASSMASNLRPTEWPLAYGLWPMVNGLQHGPQPPDGLQHRPWRTIYNLQHGLWPLAHGTQHER